MGTASCTHREQWQENISRLADFPDSAASDAGKSVGGYF